METTIIKVTDPYGLVAKYKNESWLKIGEDILAEESSKNPSSYGAVIRRFDKILHDDSWQRSVGLQTIVALIGSVLGYRFDAETTTVTKNF